MIRGSKITKFNAIIFDLEGVIADTPKLWDIGQYELIKELKSQTYTKEQYNKDREYFKPLISGKNYNDGILVLKDFFGLTQSHEFISETRYGSMKKLFEEKTEYVEGFLDFYSKIQNMKKAIATSLKPEFLNIVIEKLDLRNLFGEHIYSVDGVGVRSKPYPDIFIHAVANLYEDASCCMGIEDSLNGIYAIKNAGMISAGITTTFSCDILSRSNPDIIVKDFSILYNNIKEAIKK